MIDITLKHSQDRILMSVKSVQHSLNCRYESTESWRFPSVYNNPATAPPPNAYHS